MGEFFGIDHSQRPASLAPPIAPPIAASNGVEQDAMRCHGVAQPGQRLGLPMAVSQQHASTAIPAITLQMPRSQKCDAWRVLGPRLFYWPQGIRDGLRIGIASSRLPRPWDAWPEWFADLRQIAGSLESDQLLFVVAGTTAERMVRRCSALLRVPSLVARIGKPTMSVDAWWRLVQKREQQRQSMRMPATCFDVEISPRIIAPGLPSLTLPSVGLPLLGTDQSTNEAIMSEAGGPAERNEDLRDRALAWWSERLEVLFVRAAGTWDRLLRERSSWRQRGARSVVIPAHPKLMNDAQRKALVAEGASLRCSPDRSKRLELPRVDGSRSSVPGQSISTSQWYETNDLATSVDRLPSLLQEKYLTHWTRAPRYGWCDESEEQYIDRLLRGESRSAPTAVDALLRILVERRIRGTSRWVRGGTRVVSLTEVSLVELRERRVYRRHLRRFDFEPYGLCMRREILTRLGARPVMYGDRASGRTLNDQDRPFFQLALSRGARPVDWTCEREWRVPQEIDLTRFAADDLVVFVRTADEIDQVAAQCFWPVIALYASD